MRKTCNGYIDSQASVKSPLMVDRLTSFVLLIESIVSGKGSRLQYKFASLYEVDLSTVV